MPGDQKYVVTDFTAPPGGKGGDETTALAALNTPGRAGPATALAPLDRTPVRNSFTGPAEGDNTKDSIMKFYKKRAILPQEKLGAAADLKKNMKFNSFSADDFRLDPEEVAFLRTLKDEYAGKRRWRWWHYAALVLLNNFTFILIGAVIVSAFYGVAPGGASVSMSIGPITVDRLQVDDATAAQEVLVHSGVGKAQLELRSAKAGEASAIVLSGDKWAHIRGRGPGGGADRFTIASVDAGHMDIAQGNTSRLSINALGAYHADVDISAVRALAPAPPLRRFLGLHRCARPSYRALAVA